MPWLCLSHQPLAAESRFQSRPISCGICGGRSGTEADFTPEYFGLFPVSTIASVLCAYSSITATVCFQQLTASLNNILKKKEVTTNDIRHLK